MVDIRIEIFVPSSGESYHHDIVLLKPGVLENGKGVTGFYGRNDTFQFAQFQSGFHSLVVSDGFKSCPSRSIEMGMHRPYTRIVQSGGNRIGFGNLSVIGLHKQGFTPVNDAFMAQYGSCRAFTGIYTFTGSFYGNNTYFFFVQEMIKSTGGITATSYTG